MANSNFLRNFIIIPQLLTTVIIVVLFANKQLTLITAFVIWLATVLVCTIISVRLRTRHEAILNDAMTNDDIDALFVELRERLKIGTWSKSYWWSPSAVVQFLISDKVNLRDAKYDVKLLRSLIIEFAANPTIKIEPFSTLFWKLVEMYYSTSDPQKDSLQTDIYRRSMPVAWRAEILDRLKNEHPSC